MGLTGINRDVALTQWRGLSKKLNWVEQYNDGGLFFYPSAGVVSQCSAQFGWSVSASGFRDVGRTGSCLSPVPVSKPAESSFLCGFHGDHQWLDQSQQLRVQPSPEWVALYTHTHTRDVLNKCIIIKKFLEVNFTLLDLKELTLLWYFFPPNRCKQKT